MSAERIHKLKFAYELAYHLRSIGDSVSLRSDRVPRVLTSEIYRRSLVSRADDLSPGVVGQL